jgi:hypothetical protein
MRPVTLHILILAATLAAAGCGGGAQRGQTSRPVLRGVDAATPQPRPTASALIIVEVFGTSGTRFGGVLNELGREPKNVEGTVPTRLTLQTGAGFRVALQKRAGDSGELGMTVTVNGRQVSRSATKREFGVVTFTHRPGAR